MKTSCFVLISYMLLGSGCQNIRHESTLKSENSLQSYIFAYSMRPDGKPYREQDYKEDLERGGEKFKWKLCLYYAGISSDSLLAGNDVGIYQEARSVTKNALDSEALHFEPGLEDGFTEYFYQVMVDIRMREELSSWNRSQQALNIEDMRQLLTSAMMPDPSNNFEPKHVVSGMDQTAAYLYINYVKKFENSSNIQCPFMHPLVKAMNIFDE